MTEFNMPDGPAAVFNTSGVGTTAVARALADDGMKAVSDALTSWAHHVKPSTYRSRSRIGGMFDRDSFLAPDGPLEKIRMGRRALKDDIVGGAADGTESLVLSKSSFWCEKPDTENIWNQIAGDLNLDDRLRTAWRLLYSESQFAAAVWYDKRTYKVRGKRNTAQARTTYEDLIVPVGWTFLDTTKVIPVGSLSFGMEKLAYAASPLEAIRIDQILAKRDGQLPPPRPSAIRVGDKVHAVSRLALDELALDDPMIKRLVISRYQPDWIEVQELAEDGIDPSNLFLLNPSNVFRHTLTRPDFQRFADVRLEGLFPLLDLKAQLRQLDRTHLLGGINFIILITKGTDQWPLQPEEKTALDNQVRSFVLASIPVIIGDHRLKVEIITPRLDVTLDQKKWDVLNGSIFARAWQTFIPLRSTAEDPLKLSKIIAKGLESRRQMLRRTVEREIVDRTRRLNGDRLEGRVKLKFSPASIALSFDAAWASFLLDMRAANEISRDTTLSQFDLDQEEEAAMRRREAESGLDDVFRTLNPHGPQPESQFSGPGGAKASARAAGRRMNKGAGAAPGSGQGQAPMNPAKPSNPDNPKRSSLDSAGKLKLLNLANDLEIPHRHELTKPRLLAAVREAMSSQGLTEDDLWEDEE